MVDIQAARAKLASAAIRRALYSVWPKPMGPGLIAEAIPDDLVGTGDAIDRSLYYLCDRGHIETAGDLPDGRKLYRLSADGVDLVEAEAAFGADRARGARMLRLRVLQALDLGRPHPMGLSLISIALAEDTDLDLSEPSIRRALAYLTYRELASTKGDAWRIGADGIDYLAGDGEGITGVALPLGW